MTPIICAVYVLFWAPLTALAIGFFLFHRYRPHQAHWPILASCLAVTLASFSLLWQVFLGTHWDGSLFRWLEMGNFAVDFGVRIDGLSASVLAMVTLVGTLIHFYSVGYMEDDPHFSRFFLLFHSFFLSMIGLLVSNNYLQMYVFWEGVGLSSYFLIGFWYERPSARKAAWKAFLVNRIGDVGFLVAIFLLFYRVGSAKFEDVFAYSHSLSLPFVTVLTCLLFWAACAKSAQFPLYVWLPDAMEGPTPVSALMHAATMVTAGVFLMARSWPLIERAPMTQALIASIGAITALGAALFASMKKDLKKILAYSTVSHLGLMMLAIGGGNVFAAIFHLIAHGFFKALLFLCAGSVIHGIGTTTSASVDDTGALAGPMKITFMAFLVGALSLGGFPPFSGFFSKDLILETILEGSSLGLSIILLFIVVGSSFYIFRMLFLTFTGNRPQQDKPHAHEPGLWMQIPVIILAVCSAAVGAIGPTGILEHLIGSPIPPFEFSWLATGLGLGAACIGLGAAYVSSVAIPDWDWQWRRNHPALERLLDNDLTWQQLTHNIAADVAGFAHTVAQSWEAKRWDPWTESLAETFEGLSEGLSGLSRGLLNEYLWWMFAGAIVLTAVIVVRFQ